MIPVAFPKVVESTSVSKFAYKRICQVVHIAYGGQLELGLEAHHRAVQAEFEIYRARRRADCAARARDRDGNGDSDSDSDSDSEVATGLEEHVNAQSPKLETEEDEDGAGSSIATGAGAGAGAKGADVVCSRGDKVVTHRELRECIYKLAV